MFSYFHILLMHTVLCESCDSSVSIALGYRLDDWGSRVRFPAGLGIFLSTIASRMALRPTQPHIQWVPGALSLGVKWLRCEADHSPPSSTEIKEWVELYIHSPNVFMAWCLVKSTGTTLTLPLPLPLHCTLYSVQTSIVFSCKYMWYDLFLLLSLITLFFFLGIHHYISL
jgi:hypothetical protein